jgi:6,7-dimethyl-8-ribityllumazine synthase
MSNPDIDDSSENVLSEWPLEEDEPAEVSEEDAAPAWGSAEAVAEPEPESEPEPGLEPEVQAEPEPEGEPQPDDDDGGSAIAVAPSFEHAAGDLDIPEGYAVLEGVADGGRRAVGVVVARFNGEVTSRLLARALEELETAGVRRDAITVMVVPGAFELPVAATALAKTRRFACIVALGCVIRGDTPHFDYVASEAASGIQLAALETGVPVSFGVLTLDRVEQAEPRIEKGAEAVRSALEMADVFSHLRAAAAR